MSMFPHTITLYNVSAETDKATFESHVVNHITILKGVLVDVSKGVNVRESGLEGADSVIVYIPFSVLAEDAITGKAKKYAPPVEFWRADDKSGLWTLAITRKGSSMEGYTFFVKGTALPPDGVKPENVAEIVEVMYDHVYNITKVDEKDFGSPDMQHWEVGGA